MYTLYFFCKIDFKNVLSLYKCGPSLSDVKWRAESNATTSESWIGLVVEIIAKTCVFSEKGVFLTSKTYRLSAPATSGTIELREDLSHTYLQVLRKLHGQRASSLVAVVFPEVEKRPKMTSFFAKIQHFHYICQIKSIYETFLDFVTIRNRCTFLCSFASAIVIKLNFSTFLYRLVFMPNYRRKTCFCTEMIARLTTVKSKIMQIVWIERIRNLRKISHLKEGSYQSVAFQLPKSHAFIFYRWRWRLILSFELVAMNFQKTPLFAKNLGISPKQRLI